MSKLADEVLHLQFEFDDNRRDEIRKLAARIEQLETDAERMSHAIDDMFLPTTAEPDEEERWENLDEAVSAYRRVRQ